MVVEAPQEPLELSEISNESIDSESAGSVSVQKLSRREIALDNQILERIKTKNSTITSASAQPPPLGRKKSIWCGLAKQERVMLIANEIMSATKAEELDNTQTFPAKSTTR